jgi:hypothetical protein
MKCAVILAFCMLFSPARPAAAQKVPPVLIGVWTIGNSYVLGQPIGIDAQQESYIRSLQIGYSADFVRECGAKFAIQSVEIKTWTVEGFGDRYNFLPESIGLKGPHIEDVYINLLEGTKACGEGEFVNPGMHLFIGGNKHIVIEVANDYLPLIRGRVGVSPLTKP